MKFLPNGNSYRDDKLLADGYGPLRHADCAGEGRKEVNEATSRTEIAAGPGAGPVGRPEKPERDPGTALDENFRRAVLAYLKRSGLGGSQLGQLTLGNPGFVCTLGKGRSLTVETADRVLRFMDVAPIGPMFRREVEAFIGVTGTGQAILGLRAAGDSAFVAKLGNGSTTRLYTVQRVRAWMRGIASEAERAAIARALAGSEEAAPALAPDPAALRALVETPPADRDTGRAACEQPAFLTTRQAAAFLTLSPRTLDRHRAAGKGPAFHKFETRIAYARADLEAWAKERRRGRPLSPG